MKKVPVLALLGGLLLAFSLVGLYFLTPADLLQYAFLPEAAEDAARTEQQGENSSPTSRMGGGGTEAPGDTAGSGNEDAESGQTEGANSTASSLGKAMEKYRSFLDSPAWSSGELPMTLEGRKTEVSVTRDKTTTISDVTLVMAGPRYGEVYPRKIREGTWFSETEIADAAREVVLDSALAFELYGDLSPVGQTVSVEEKDYTVIGVAEHQRSLGSRTEYTAWIPFLADSSLTPELLTVSALPGASGEAYASLWKSTAREGFGAGSFYHLAHEKVRGSLLPRMMLLLAAFALLKKWFALLKKIGKATLADARRRAARSYPSRLIGYAALRLLLGLILLAGTLGVLYLVAMFAVRPLSVFPEWVPDNPVALSSITARFWTLINESASPVRLMTEQLAIVQFWSLLVLLGSITLLLGIAFRWLKRALEGRRPAPEGR